MILKKCIELLSLYFFSDAQTAQKSLIQNGFKIYSNDIDDLNVEQIER